MNLISEVHLCMLAHLTSVRNNRVNYNTSNNNSSNEKFNVPYANVTRKDTVQ